MFNSIKEVRIVKNKFGWYKIQGLVNYENSVTLLGVAYKSGDVWEDICYKDNLSSLGNFDYFIGLGEIISTKNKGEVRMHRKYIEELLKSLKENLIDSEERGDDSWEEICVEEGSFISENIKGW